MKKFNLLLIAVVCIVFAGCGSDNSVYNSALSDEDIEDIHFFVDSTQIDSIEKYSEKFGSDGIIDIDGIQKHYLFETTLRSYPCQIYFSNGLSTISVFNTFTEEKFKNTKNCIEEYLEIEMQYATKSKNKVYVSPFDNKSYIAITYIEDKEKGTGIRYIFQRFETEQELNDILSDML